MVITPGASSVAALVGATTLMLRAGPAWWPPTKPPNFSFNSAHHHQLSVMSHLCEKEYADYGGDLNTAPDEASEDELHRRYIPDLIPSFDMPPETDPDPTPSADNHGPPTCADTRGPAIDTATVPHVRENEPGAPIPQRSGPLGWAQESRRRELPAALYHDMPRMRHNRRPRNEALGRGKASNAAAALRVAPRHQSAASLASRMGTRRTIPDHSAIPAPPNRRRQVSEPGFPYMDETAPPMLGDVLSAQRAPPLRRLPTPLRPQNPGHHKLGNLSYQALRAGLERGSLFLHIAVRPPSWTGIHATSGLWAPEQKYVQMRPTTHKRAHADFLSDHAKRIADQSSHFIIASSCLDYVIWRVARMLSKGFSRVWVAVLAPPPTGPQAPFVATELLSQDPRASERDLSSAFDSGRVLFFGRVFGKSIIANTLWTAEVSLCHGLDLQLQCQRLTVQALPFSLPPKFWRAQPAWPESQGWLSRLRCNPDTTPWEQAKPCLLFPGNEWEGQPVHSWVTLVHCMETG